MQLASRIFAIVSTIVLLCSAVSGSECTLSAVPITHTIAGCSTPLALGTQSVCKNSDHNCKSLQLMGWAIDSSNAVSEKEARHCVPSAYRVVSGSLTQSQVIQSTGCNSYSAGPLAYKYANATSCICHLSSLYYP